MSDLSYKTKWNNVITLENWLSPNEYTCKIHFDIATDNGDEQNVAFERCKVLFDVIFNNSLLISIDNPLLPILKKKTSQKIITLPTEPLDLVIASMLYHKCNAICEGRLDIIQVDIKSSQGDNIWIHFDEDFAENSDLDKLELFQKINETPWWHRLDASHADWFEKTKAELKYHKHAVAWEKSLLWEQEDGNIDNKVSKWKPTIINGGKTQH